MDSSESVIQTILMSARSWIDETDLNPKLTDSFLVDHHVGPAMNLAFDRISKMTRTPILIGYSLSTVVGTKRYALPANIKHIMALRKYGDDNETLLNDYEPRGLFNPAGRGWAIEGNEIVFDKAPTMVENFQVLYIPGSDFRLSRGTGNLIDDSGHKFQLDTQTLGRIDRRRDAYAGNILRLLPTGAASYVEDRIISSSQYDGSAQWEVTLTADFADQGDVFPVSDVPYEIVPIGMESMADFVGLLTAWRISILRRFPTEHRRALEDALKAARKTAGDQLAHFMKRMPMTFDRLTMDNTRGREHYTQYGQFH